MINWVFCIVPVSSSGNYFDFLVAGNIQEKGGRKLNICFIGHFTAGGTESATYLVANALCDRHKVFVLNTCVREPSFKLKQKIEFDYLRNGSIPIRTLALTKYLIVNKIDVLVSVEAMTGIFSIIAAKMAKCKHIVWEHANYYQNQGSRWIQKIRQLELFLVDGYVVLTKRDLNNFRRHFRCKTRLQQIYNIADGRQDNPYLEDSKTIISAGHIRKIKNFIIIPEVAKIVFAKHPDWKWVLYGTGAGEEYERIRQKVKEYRLENNVVFFGRCNNMEKEYPKAAMYVMTSLQEGLPMVLLEAKSFGLPLISFNIETGPDEIIRNAVNGFLIPPYNAEIMAEKICRLIEDNDLRKSFSANESLDLEKFAPERITEQWNNLIKAVTER